MDQENPITDAEQLNEYDIFQTYLESCLNVSRIQAKCIPAKPPIDGITVTLDTSESVDFVNAKLDEWIEQFKKVRPKLCLVKDASQSSTEFHNKLTE